MLWKELREQAAILIALLALGTGVIAAATTFGSTVNQDAGVGDARAYTNAGRLAVLSLAVAAGVVVGGSLFAGERENGTLDCLESLPATRRHVWRAKVAAGGLMAGVAGAGLLAVGVALGALGGTALAGWVLWGVLLVLTAFAWGVFGSAVTESTLAACSLGLVCAAVFGTVVFLVLSAVVQAIVGFGPASRGGVWAVLPQLVAMTGVVVVPLMFAARMFSGPDRARRGQVAAEPSPRRRRRASRPESFAGLKALVWLTNRQWFAASLIGGGIALVTGFLALHETMHLLLLWPTAATMAGVFGGVLAWADEQGKTTFKYWGERRLPLGRLWAMKLVTSSARTLGWVLLIFAPSLIRQASEGRGGPLIPAAFRSGLLSQEGPELLYFLFVWPVYGFAFGHLAGLLFRKTIVALGVGMLTAAPVASLWLPSLLTGGVHHWQLWPIPLVVLLATRLILRPWSADRLGSLRPIGTLAAAGVACLAWLVAGLSVRIGEVPLAAEANDDLRFADTVPQLDSDDGGRLYRQTPAAFRGTLANPNAPRNMRDVGAISRERLVLLAAGGWPPDDLRRLDGWLADPVMRRVFDTLHEAADKPLGPLENPRGIIAPAAPLADARELRLIVTAVLADGLHKQQAGDPAAFPRCLDAALAATRNGRTMQPREIFHLSVSAERTAFDALDQWLQRLDGRVDLVRAAVAVLEKHDRLCPRDLRPVFLTERMIERNRLLGLSQWSPQELEFQLRRLWRGAADDVLKAKATAEAELLGVSLAVPWERERYHRLLGRRNADTATPSRPGEMSTWLAGYFSYQPPQLDGTDRVSRAALVVTACQVRLRLFELEKGRPAATLEELVPAYLPAVPADPFDGRPLRYRVSRGEQIRVGIPSRPPEPPGGSADDDGERLALSAVLGTVCEFRPRPETVPSVPGARFIHDTPEWAAAVGGLAHAHLDPLDEAAEPTRSGVAGSRIAVEDAVWREVEAGQGVVWSIGPDKADNGGRVVFDLEQRGDLLRVVPKGKR